jgi:hypothetical protein
MTSNADAYVAEQVASIIKPFLAGRDPGVQGAVLADLLSIWIAGFHPALREEMLALHIKGVVSLIEVSEREIFGPDGHPGHKESRRD